MEPGSIGVVAAFAAGVVSFLSPCVLPLVPGYVSYVVGAPPSSGTSDDVRFQGAARTLSLSLCFVLGFSTVFVILGAGATTLSWLLLTHMYEANLVGGIVVIVFGLFTAGLVPMPWLNRELRFHSDSVGSRPGAAYVLGLAFAFGWTPCIGPVLGAILALSASDATALGGTALLAVYSLGLGLPFVLAALFMRGFVARLATMRRAGRILKIVSGLVMIAMGVAMISGHLRLFAFQLLEAFPALGRIG